MPHSILDPVEAVVGQERVELLPFLEYRAEDAPVATAVETLIKNTTTGKADSDLVVNCMVRHVVRLLLKTHLAWIIFACVNRWKRRCNV